MKRRGVGNACVEEFEDPTINWMDGREDRQKVRILGLEPARQDRLLNRDCRKMVSDQRKDNELTEVG